MPRRQDPSPWGSPQVELCLVVAAAIAAHATALAGGFVWLDHGDLEAGAAVLPPGQWLSLFAQGFARTGFYRPALALSFSLEAATGAGPWLSHLVTLVWHGLTAATVVLAARALGLPRKAALGGGLLFGVHPLTSLVAAVLSFRSESMVAACLLGLVATHVARKELLSGLLLFLGALSKETALVLGPAFIVAVELSMRAPRGGKRVSLADQRRLFAAEGLGLVAALALRAGFAPPWQMSHPPLALGEAIGTRLAAVAKSAAAMALPVDLSVCDAVLVSGPFAPAALVGALLVSGLLYGAVRWRGAVALGALSLLPSLNLVPTPRLWSAHYLYLPLAFAAMGVAVAVVRLGRRAFVPFALALALLGANSLRLGRKFWSDEALFSSDAAARPECREGRLYLGDAKRMAGDLDGAATEYEAAVAPTDGFVAYSDEAAAFQNLGLVRLTQGRFLEADRSFRAALERTTEEQARRRLVHDLAASAFGRSDFVEAARLLESEVARVDAFRESLYLYARAQQELGRDKEWKAAVERLGAQGGH